MKTVGNFLLWFGLMLFGSTAAIPQMLDPESCNSTAAGFSTVLIPALGGLALMTVGFVVVQSLDSNRKMQA